jgi:hypothetical protein
MIGLFVFQDANPCLGILSTVNQGNVMVAMNLQHDPK